LAFVHSQGAVDMHLSDQLVLYMALAEGHSALVTERVTPHLVTNMWVIEQFFPVTFKVAAKTGRIEVNGIGLRAE